MVPSDPVEEAGEIVTGKISLFAAGFDYRSVRKNHFETEHMIRGNAVGQGVWPACIFGDVAPDSASALAGGVGRVEVVGGIDGGRDVEVDDAGLQHGAFVFEIDFENAIHAREGDDDTAFARDGASGESGAGAAAGKGNMKFAGEVDNGGNIFCGAGEYDKIGTVLIYAAIVFVECKVFGAVEQIALAEEGGETRRDADAGMESV